MKLKWNHPDVIGIVIGNIVDTTQKLLVKDLIKFNDAEEVIELLSKMCRNILQEKEKRENDK